MSEKHIEYVTGILQKKDEEENDKGWTKLMVGKVNMATRYAAKVDGIKEGATYKAGYSIQSKTRDGKTYVNNYLESLEPVEGASVASAPPKTDWEAKDRRIAMEAAYHAASRYYQGREGGSADLQMLARGIYADIMQAGRDEPFGDLEELPF